MERAKTTIRHLLGKEPEDLKQRPEDGVKSDTFFGAYLHLPMPTEARPASIHNKREFDDAVFWQIIEKADWPNDSKGSWTTWVEETLTETQIKALEEGYRVRRQMLVMTHVCYIMATGDAIAVGDDSYGDLIDHIMGCGKEEYTLSMADPKRISERGRKGDYDENFHYLFMGFKTHEIEEPKIPQSYPQKEPPYDGCHFYEPWLVRYFQTLYGTL